MSTLLCTLPPLSPDYSGVVSVLHDLGALVVIHDASGCTGTYTGYDEPRWFGSRSPIFCSGLREIDAIMGDDEKLVAKIRAALDDKGAPLVAIVGSPVPMVIGFDFQGFASLVEYETGVPTLGFATNGLSLYDRGQKEAYLALARRFLTPDPEPVPDGVNLLGASALDGFDAPALDAIEAMLADAGMTRVSVWGARSPLEDLARTGGAQANWVLSAAALPLARLLHERFGTPYVAGVPVGEREQTRILSGLQAIIAGRTPACAFPPVVAPCSPAATDGRVLVVGERLLGASLRACLAAEFDVPAASNAGFFGDDAELHAPGDRRFATEAEAAEAFADPGLALIIGDPLFERLLPESAATRFLPLPHTAVSGRLHRDSRARLFGAAGVSAFAPGIEPRQSRDSAAVPSGLDGKDTCR